MVLLISDNEAFNKLILPVLDKLGYVVFANRELDVVKFYNIRLAIICASNNTAVAEETCKALKRLDPKIKILAAVPEELHSSSVYLDVSGSDRQIVLPCSKEDLIFELERSLTPFFSIEQLEFGYGRYDVALLGYELKLSRSEYVLLRILARNYPDFIDDGLLQNYFSKMSFNCLKVHICGINQKADRITGRRLVIRKDGRYCINKNM